MNSIQRYGSNHRLSEAVVANGFVFLSGMVPENTKGNITEQTADVLNQIDAWLVQCGSDKSHILEATIYLSDLNDYVCMNEVWDKWVDAQNTPARACVEAKLANAEWKVEIKVSAVQKKIEA
ncbi:MAG: RidA family protein [Alysiella sp.]|uniref:RidA family protein n=1 Tax=Alysiella sp. TaxID=1872483 RepID=UPI0026DD3EC3|nr:RidA family protein [Alysiella sp.]MDO4434115.1 RidA family protein [Alysiella sp.]